MQDKIKSIFIICFLTNLSIIAQSELYVLSKDIAVSNANRDCDRIDDRGLFKSHEQGRYVIGANQVTIKVNGFVDIIVEDQDDQGCSGSCGQGGTERDSCSITNGDQVLNHYNRVFSQFSGTVPTECFTCMPLSYQAILLPRLTTPPDRRCERQDLFPQYSGGGNRTVSGLTWQYRNTAGVFVDLPTFKNRYPLNVSLLDIFGSNWRSRFNNNLDLRFKISASFTSEVVYSNIVTVQLTECSPELVGPIIPIETKCNYTSDGKFTINLDRDLVVNEKLIVSLYVQNEINANQYDFVIQEDPTSLHQVSSGKFSYSWQGNIAAGNYKIKYQTLQGNGGVSDTDPSWASLEFSPVFTILNADAIDYSVLVERDETCKSENDGEIKLEVTAGESGRNYSYIVYKVDGSNVTVHKNWTVFSGLNTTVSSLGKDTYRLQIRDNQGCYAR